MAGNAVNGSGNGARSGAQTLILLSAQLNCLILRTLAAGPRQLGELRQQTGAPAQTTLRAQLRRLVELGAIERHRRNRFPGALQYELTPAGRDLLFVIDVLDSWLGGDPEGPPLGTSAAKATVGALAEGWSTAMLRALATGPISLTELDGTIGSLSYPSLERRLTALRLTGLIDARQGNGRGTPYQVTTWLRQGAAPLLASMRWERLCRPADSPSVGRLDVETVLLLAAPLLRLPPEAGGTCRIAVELPGDDAVRAPGVTIELKNGTVASCSTDPGSVPDAWVLGSLGAWFAAIVDDDAKGLELRGDTRFARVLLNALHRALFRFEAIPLDAAMMIGDDGAN